MESAIGSHWIVERPHDKMRLDLFLTEITSYSRSQIQKKIMEGLIRVNHKLVKPKELIHLHDEVTLTEAVNEFTPFKLLPSHILFEDEHILVINKPAGLNTHRGAGVLGPNLADSLKQMYHSLEDDPKGIRKGIVHRLDKDTSGVLVTAKTKLAYDSLKNQIKTKVAKRTYEGLFDGVIKDQAYESYLFKDPKNRLRYESSLEQLNENARYSKSTFKTKKIYWDRLSLIEITLDTGRTHQIRVHAKALKAPILGDPVYNKGQTLSSVIPVEVKKAIQQLSRQMLHSYTLSFKHPSSLEEVFFKANPPSDFMELNDLFMRYHKK